VKEHISQLALKLAIHSRRKKYDFFYMQKYSQCLCSTVANTSGLKHMFLVNVVLGNTSAQPDVNTSRQCVVLIFSPAILADDLLLWSSERQTSTAARISFGCIVLLCFLKSKRDFFVIFFCCISRWRQSGTICWYIYVSDRIIFSTLLIQRNTNQSV
jgi:hypothetical protein